MTPERDADFATWVDEARAVPIEDEATRRGLSLKRIGAELVGPCPVCGGRDRFAINPRKAIFHCRGAAKGGDVIALVEYLDACDFTAACTTLAGRPPPGSGQDAGVVDHDERRRREEERVAREAEAERFDIDYRERERRKAYDIWRAAAPISHGSPVAAYLAGRGLELPSGPLREATLPYWHQSAAGKPLAVHSGPAMVAPIVDDAGRFAGAHLTWVDQARPGNKAAIVDPATGEILPAKKVRGSKRRASIRLACGAEAPRRLVVGEGIETVLSVWMAERETLGARSAYWSAVDLGHLGGKAAATVVHPSRFKADKRGFKRRTRTPGPVPELQPDRDLMPPEGVSEIILLGDGDSDRFTTEMALARAAARWAQAGRIIRVAWAPDGEDFNDVLQGAA